jgi:hypothetical protein
LPLSHVSTLFHCQFHALQSITSPSILLYRSFTPLFIPSALHSLVQSSVGLVDIIHIQHFTPPTTTTTTDHTRPFHAAQPLQQHQAHVIKPFTLRTKQQIKEIVENFAVEQKQRR